MVDDLDDVVQQAVELERASVATQILAVAATIRSVQQELIDLEKEVTVRVDRIRQVLGAKS